MFFTSSKQVFQQNNIQNNNLLLNMQNRNMQLPIRQLPTPSVNNTQITPVTRTKTMKWGEPTWFLFHTLSYKIKDEYFVIIREELLNIIYTICYNLPCPDCANHASDYLKSINFNSIQTKEQLKKMLFIFHNVVNTRKGYELFPYENFDDKYSKANTINIIQNFMVYFKNKHSSIHMIANDLHRNRIANSLMEWFKNNIKYFDK
jgi:hypothetical protein